MTHIFSVVNGPGLGSRFHKPIKGTRDDVPLSHSGTRPDGLSGRCVQSVEYGSHGTVGHAVDLLIAHAKSTVLHSVL